MNHIPHIQQAQVPLDVDPTPLSNTADLASPYSCHSASVVKFVSVFLIVMGIVLSVVWVPLFVCHLRPAPSDIFIVLVHLAGWTGYQYRHCRWGMEK